MKLTRKQLAGFLIDNPGKQASNQVASYLLSEGRSKELSLVVREVEVILGERGRVVAHVTSARELDAAQEKALTKQVITQTGAKSVEIINDIDPSLLGGVVIRTPEMEVDLSVRAKLERLKRA